MNYAGEASVYQFRVSITVQREHRDDLVRAAPGAARDLLVNEPGSPRFEVLNEVYADVDAFNAHASGPYFGAFVVKASTYAVDPNWFVKGNLADAKVIA